MKFKKVMATVLAVAISLCYSTGTYAANTENQKNPDLIFYRARARDTFEGTIQLTSGKGSVTSVKLSQDEEPALVISGFDDNEAWFDSLYKTAEQVLIVTKDAKETEVPVSLAVYDSVTLIPVQGSVTLTVKNGKTFQPVAGAEYALYKGSKRLEDGLYSDSSGKITVTNLEPGSYELRPSSTVEGYQAAGSTIPFVIGGMKLSGGEQSIRTSAGKKITAEEDEVLIAGNFTKDIELTATKEDQITSISVTYANAGAELEKSGKKEERTFGTAKEAESDINQRKANGEITGSVEIAYTLKGGSGKSTCNFTQYLEAKPAAVATPKPDGNSGTQNGNSSNGGQTYTPTPTPSPTVKPIATPQPITQPIENLTIASFADNGKLSGFVFRLEGTTVDGNSYVKEYKTDEKGEITGIIPAGTYIVSAKDCTANKGYELPQDQVVQVTATEKEYLSFAFVSTERNLTLAVTDDDGVPLENVTVGIFSAELLDEVEEDRDPKTQTNGVTDVSQQISDIHAQEDREALLANPFEKRNALKIGKTDEKGIVELEGLPVTALLAVPIDTPVGYTMEKKPSQIPAGLQTQADVTCEYVKVDVQVVNRETGSPAMGIQAVLLDEEGNELAQWTTDGKEQTFIRVPEGEYSLQLTYGDQTETLTYEVIREQTNQEFTLETGLTGIVDEAAPTPKNTSNQVVLILAVMTGIAMLTVGGILVFRKHKKKGHGIS